MAATQEQGEQPRGILAPEVGGAHFDLTRLVPSPALAERVDRHWIVSWNLGEAGEFTQQILPHPCVNLASQPGLIGVWGIPRSRSAHHLERAGIAVGTKFRPGAFAGFADAPAESLNDRVVPLGELWGRAGADLERELAACAGDPEGHIEAVEAFLEARLPEPDRDYELVRAAVEAMLAAPPRTTVAELAAARAVSPRTLQRAFRSSVGVGPKWVLRRYRLHEAAERIAAGEAEDAAALALELGYFDQPHFVRDFTAQIGVSPGAYARACNSARPG